MTEFMTEQLVKRRETLKNKLIKALIVAVAISLFVIFFPILLAIPALFFVWIFIIVLVMYLFQRMNVEFEYVYFNGDLDIDKIVNKQSRKSMFKTNIKEDMDFMAPTGAPELYQYQNLKKLDFSTKTPENKTYTMITLHKGQKVQVIFEPNEEILKGIRDWAPRKIIF